MRGITVAAPFATSQSVVLEIPNYTADLQISTAFCNLKLIIVSLSPLSIATRIRIIWSVNSRLYIKPNEQRLRPQNIYGQN